MSTTKIERRIFTDAELRVEERDGKKYLVGYAAKFNSFSLDLGGFREIIRPGAFSNTLAGGADVRALINHNPDKVLGRTKSGTLRLAQDERGLRIENDLPDTQTARDLMVSMKRGDIDGMSFGFRVREGGDAWREENGKAIRELHDVDLDDVTVATYPAYPTTEVALRSLDAWRKAQEAAREPEVDMEVLKRRLALAERNCG